MSQGSDSAHFIRSVLDNPHQMSRLTDGSEMELATESAKPCRELEGRARQVSAVEAPYQLGCCKPRAENRCVLYCGTRESSTPCRQAA